MVSLIIGTFNCCPVSGVKGFQLMRLDFLEIYGINCGTATNILFSEDSGVLKVWYSKLPVFQSL